jgi:hypothetical protein
LVSTRATRSAGRRPAPAISSPRMPSTACTCMLSRTRT